MLRVELAVAWNKDWWQHWGGGHKKGWEREPDGALKDHITASAFGLGTLFDQTPFLYG